MPSYYSEADIERLIVQAQRGVPRQGVELRQRNTAIVMLMAFAGLRRGEVIGMRAGDIDFNRRVMRVLGKGGRERMVPLVERLVVALRYLCKDKPSSAPVFEGLKPKAIHRAITTLARAAGLEGLHAHSLRHAFATRLVERKGNLRAVQMLLGHQSLETTHVYVDVSAQGLFDTIGLLEAQTGTPVGESATQPAGPS